MDSAPGINKEVLKEYDPSQPIDSISGRYSHGGISQEEREKSAKEALRKLQEDETARRNYLVKKLDAGKKNFNAKEYMELQDLLSSAGDLSQEEKEKIVQKMQSLD